MTEKGIAVLSSSSNIYLSYINSICLSKNITLYTNSLLEFPIKEFIRNGIDQFEFSFVEIYRYLTIFKNSIEVKTGEVFHDLNNFTYFLKIETYFKDFFLIKIKNHVFDNTCEINVDVSVSTNINTYKESHKCFKNDNYDTINNIIHSNLYDYFTVHKEDFIQFEFTMENEPKDNELILYYEAHSFNCFRAQTKMICDVPIYLFPRLKIVHLYSYLSCYNLIDVGWFEINDKNIFNIYSLINYDFDYISEIYDPSQKITEYNPAMINYYYWFSGLSYCDDKKIEQSKCSNNILSKWEIFYHKEYNYDKSLLDLFVDIVLTIAQNSKGLGDPYDVVGGDPKEYVDDLYEQYSNNKETIISLLKKSKEYLPATFLGIYFEQLINAVYQYNFVILKNDEYKKIVIAFPGLTFYFQILDELINQGMVDLLDIPPKTKKQYYSVLEMYYTIFKKLEKDLFDNLEAISGIKNDTDFQVIFTGHSIGGAIATISSFYYIKKYNFKAKNILITFGQPKVGNEIFAEELTENLKQIYRIARPNDIATTFPSMRADYLFKFLKIAKLGVDIYFF